MPPPPPPEPQWPPRSPREAALGTPGGRDRLRRNAERTPPSPLSSPTRNRSSPLRHSRSASALAGGGRRTQLLDPIELVGTGNGAALGSGSDNDDDDGNDDEDEETLQLKLAEIRARLKLKRLQNRAKKAGGDAGDRPSSSRAGDTGDDPFGPLCVGRRDRPSTAPGPAAPPPPPRDRNKNIVAPPPPPPPPPPPRHRNKDMVEVPASPVRKVQPPVQTSPVRVLLGIDKGLKAKDVSLKRAPVRKTRDAAGQQAGAGGYLRRSRTPNPGSENSSAAEIARPLSFNERLAHAKAEESRLNEARERVRQVRTEAFAINRQDMEQFKQNAVDIPDDPRKETTEFTREEILARPAAAAAPDRSSGGKDQRTNAEETSASFEAYSSIHLSRRIIPHQVLARHLAGKKIMELRDLLGEVKSPDYVLPDVEQDIVLFAILAKKSEPRAHKPAADGRESAKGKYMVWTLVDLQHEVELFLFNSGFERFWKLTEGTLVAVLNPGVMPPPPGRLHSGRFSLVVNSDADKILEVGMARDLGYCKSVKRDASVCGSWVNRRRTEFCEYHTNEAVRRTAQGRLELGSASIGFGGGAVGGGGGHKPKFGRAGERKEDHRRGYDRESGTHWYASRTLSAAELIDGADRARGVKDREDALKRRLAAKEREQDIMKKLGQLGGGAGQEYMRRGFENHCGGSGSGTAPSSTPFSSSTATGPGSSGDNPAPDARSLGLIAPRGAGNDVHLSPVHKRKRLDSGQSSQPVAKAGAGTAGFGWGGSLQDKLSRMREGEKLRSAVGGQEGGGGGGAERPARKKTRFVTERGIREAGRESLGMDMLLDLDLDDGDELVIT